MTSSTAPETRSFQAEAQELLGLVIHSLYTEKDIFLRELISNASDALDKRRHAALTDPSLLPEDETLEILIELDEDARTLAVIDNGIGMSREELVENLGTIAKSGTRGFLDEIKKAGAEGAPELIGQFGVGFYSCFMVADEVVVESLPAGAETGARWRSTADGSFTVEDAAVPAVGTRITLHMKPADPTEKDAPDFLSPWTVRDVVKRHSDFVAYPIRTEVEATEPVLDDEGQPIEGETKTITKIETINSMTPLWARPKNEITDEEYADFYRHLTHDWSAPYAHIHFTAEAPVEYTSLLYFPEKRPMDMFEAPRRESRLSLYVKRVLIMEACEELLPPWLRFVRGLVDCPDLPLNVSRQTLQANPVVSKIRRHLVTRVLKALAEKLAEDRTGYATFFGAFGRDLKEGIYEGADDGQRISSICLFPTTHGAEPTTLAEYVERMPDDQEAIFYIAGTDHDALEASPHLEAFKKQGTEVLVLADAVDEWMLQGLPTFDSKPLTPVHKGDAKLESDEEQKKREEQEVEQRPFLEALQTRLGDDVSAVRLSSRLTDSPAVIVPDEGAMGTAVEQMLREMGRDVPKSSPALELNAEHPAVVRLREAYEADPEGADFGDLAALLFGQAVLADGRLPQDPVGYARLIAKLMHR